MRAPGPAARHRCRERKGLRHRSLRSASHLRACLPIHVGILTFCVLCFCLCLVCLQPVRTYTDEEILASPLRVKKYLEEHGRQYEVGSPGHVLRGMAKAHMKRVRDESLSPQAKKALVDDVTALQLSEFKEMVDRIVNNAEKTDKFYRVVFKFEELGGPYYTRLKHGIVMGCCKGNIVDGTCRKCGEENISDGILQYGFKACVADARDSHEHITLQVWIAEAAGNSMFNTPAHVFKTLPTDAINDKIERIMCVPMSSTFILKHDPEKNDTFITMFDVAKVDM